MFKQHNPKIKSKPKAGSAEYYRAYRKRRKNEKKGRGGTITTRKPLALKLNLFLVVILALNTAYLIYMATQILTGQIFERIIVAILGELLLLVLVAIRPETWPMKVARFTLLLGFSIYAIVPFVADPIQRSEGAAKRLAFAEESIKQTLAQIPAQRKLYDELIARSRISAAQSLANDLAMSAQTLRNANLERARAADSSVLVNQTPPLAVALQRVLFVLMNMLLSHMIADEWRTRKTHHRGLKSMRPSLRLVPSTS